MLAGLFLTLGWRAWSKRPPVLRGIREVAEFLDTAAPNELIFMTASLTAAFIFWVRAGDDGMDRMVVRGDKLLP